MHVSLSLNGSMLMIKPLTNKHTCQDVKKNKTTTSSWTSRLANDWKDYPNLDCNGMKTILRKRYGLSMPSTKLCKARWMVKGDTVRNRAKEFVIRSCYAHMILKTILGSIAKIKSKLLHTQNPAVFQRLFVCFDGNVFGFVAICRPFLAFDGSQTTLWRYLLICYRP